ncbi:MAG: hypothetical protein GXY01_04550 [Clostridiales bacterium]|nr:hypothetical protein [Clostridiales bacterium]
MKKTLMSGFVLILSLALLVFGALTALAFNSRLISDTKQELLSCAALTAKEFDPKLDADEQASAFSAAIGDIRITIVSSDGTVLGDSQADHRTMENHLDRSEIIQASASGQGTSVRNSETIGKKLVYSAVETPDGYFIRATKEVAGVFGHLISVVPAMVLSMLFSLLLAAYLINRFSVGFINPIIEMNDSLIGVKDGGKLLNPKDYRYGELEDMAVKINVISSHLSKYISNIQQEKEKLNYILDNVGEGFLLLDEKLNILLINNSACVYLNCRKSAVGEHILLAVRDFNFIQCAERAIKEKTRLLLDLELSGKIVESVFRYVEEESGFSASLIITMSDVTENRNSVKMRREFFSNASHELKTPITSIKGSAELLCSDLPISEKQRKELLTRIGVESERMNMLINDIIMISRMESGDLAGDIDNIDISEAINESLIEIAPMAEQDNLTVNVEIKPVFISANKKDIRELVSNLLVNAVKYNRQGGCVDISLKEQNGEAILKVRNDGEPIPLSQQRRVFERFYRVDSGRSKTIGGTGLGLSIVKHVVDSLNGAVSLESSIESGTAFTVRLPVSADN